MCFYLLLYTLHELVWHFSSKWVAFSVFCLEKLEHRWCQDLNHQHCELGYWQNWLDCLGLVVKGDWHFLNWSESHWPCQNTWMLFHLSRRTVLCFSSRQKQYTITNSYFLNCDCCLLWYWRFCCKSWSEGLSLSPLRWRTVLLKWSCPSPAPTCWIKMLAPSPILCVCCCKVQEETNGLR